MFVLVVGGEALYRHLLSAVGADDRPWCPVHVITTACRSASKCRWSW
ncbi:hypothetical protein CCP3SC1AL1_2430002 [Gammaproteobacteria bacterium]